MTNNLTQGSILRAVVRFAIPYLVSYLLQTFYGLADLFIVGRFAGVEATTAVAIGSQIMHMTTVMTVGLAMGSTVLVGRAVGEDTPSAKHRAGIVIGNTITLFLSLSIAAALVLVLLARHIISIMSTPIAATDETLRYTVICFVGIPAIVAYNIIASVLRGMGDTKSPLLFVAIACVINIALDCLFIGAWQMGATGAALGTVIAQGAVVIISLATCRRRFVGDNADIPLHKEYCIPALTVMRELLLIGAPVSLQDGFIQVSFLVITVIANTRGLTDAAAVGIVEKVIGIMFLIPSSMLSTVSVMSAQCIGAGQVKRARASLRTCLCISIIASLMIAIITQPLAPAIVGLFTNDNIVASRGGEYLRSYVWDCVLAGVHFCFSGYFCALSLSLLSFAHNAASIILCRIPLAYIASRRFPDTLLPMGVAPPVGSLLSCIICIAAYVYLCKNRH